MVTKVLRSMSSPDDLPEISILPESVTGQRSSALHGSSSDKDSRNLKPAFSDSQLQSLIFAISRRAFVLPVPPPSRADAAGPIHQASDLGSGDE